MHEQLSIPGPKYWYSLIGASPKPENGESANVAVVLGNGRLFRLEYLERLPRLAGIAAPDEIGVYQAVLETIAERVSRGFSVEDLRTMLGSQLHMSEPRELFVEPTDDLIRRLKQRFLRAPKLTTLENEDAIIRRSVAMLDTSIEQAGRRGVLIQQDVRPSNLYPNRIERFTKGHRVPKLARAIRGHGRDVLIDSIVIDPLYERRDMFEVVSRIDLAFFLYDQRLRSAIRSLATTEIHTVGVIHSEEPELPEHLVDLRNFVRDNWSRHGANVIDSSEIDPSIGIADEIAWVREGAG
jgi:hypothetical protein